MTVQRQRQLKSALNLNDGAIYSNLKKAGNTWIFKA
jgi:hypothetical protein